MGAWENHRTAFNHINAYSIGINMVKINLKGKSSKKGFMPKKAKAAAPKVSAPLRNAIKAVAKSQMETKYVGETIFAQQLVTAGASVPANLNRMLAQVAQGNADNQRIGDRIEPIRATTRWTVHFQNAVSNNFEDLQYNLLVLSVKGVKNGLSLGAVPVNSLLRNGAGGNVDPTVGAFSQNQFIEQVNNYPVNTDQFTVLKHFKHRFAKGSYDITGVPGASATSQIANGSPCVTFSYSWKPPTLDYNTAVDTLPTNHYPVFIHWVSVNDAGAYSGNLVYGCRTDLFYKDA